MRVWHVMAMGCVAVMMALAGPADAQGYGYGSSYGPELKLRLGLFQPKDDSLFWETQFTDFTGDIEDFEDWSLGVDYLWRFSERSAFSFGFGYTGGGTTQAYRDWLDADGLEIRHQTDLERAELNAAWVLSFTPPRSRVSPYVGIGGGFVWWRLSEDGDFIDFSDEELPVFTTSYSDSGVTTELFALAGVGVQLSEDLSFVLEARVVDAEAELAGDYDGFGNLDLSGTEISAGFSLRY